MITTEILAQIKRHADECAPRECCGLIVRVADGNSYWPCRNLSPLDDQFQLHPEDWAEAEDTGDVVAVVHSHVNRSARPSQADRLGCERSGLPWLIVAHPSGEVATLAPTGWQLPLVGREFVWGICDCFTLLRDYYQGELGIAIAAPPDGYAPDFWKDGKTYYSRFAEWGFVELGPEEAPQRHDVFLMLIKSDEEPNHAGIYLGDGLMLHHLEERLSERVPYGGFWQQVTRFVVRHQSLMEATA